ncbi:MAG: methyltransferase domain-containing protein [Acidobacteriota bacterium]|jgi:ubiquinone/menaquinone biosynthesis C-methylase UbiE|nr:methyltransferase domain-containing protein [Acidobacteriota bacterium]
MSKNKEYILGSSEREIERLAYQNEVWFDATNDLWKKAEIGYGDSVVDLGCGPGFCTFPLSRLVGSEGHIFAVDSSDKFASLIENKINANNTKNISFHKNDAESLSLEDSSADIVFSRWLFCFLENPDKVLTEIKRVLKPNGKLIIIDYFNYRAANIFPQKNALSELFKAYLQIVTDHKGSYNIGEILPELIIESGLQIESLTPICRIARPNTRIWKWVELFNEVSVPSLVEQGIWSEKQKTEFEAEWNKAKQNPAAFFFTPPMIGIIAKKSV